MRLIKTDQTKAPQSSARGKPALLYKRNTEKLLMDAMRDKQLGKR